MIHRLETPKNDGWGRREAAAWSLPSKGANDEGRRQEGQRSQGTPGNREENRRAGIGRIRRYRVLIPAEDARIAQSGCTGIAWPIGIRRFGGVGSTGSRPLGTDRLLLALHGQSVKRTLFGGCPEILDDALLLGRADLVDCKRTSDAYQSHHIHDGGQGSGGSVLHGSSFRRFRRVDSPSRPLRLT